MSILIDQTTRVLVQGATGKEGARAVRSMREYGTHVVAGVTPGKGGTTSEEGLSIYNTVAEAVRAHPTVNASLIAVPGKFVLGAAEEAVAARIPLINILSEQIPVAEVARLIASTRAAGIRVVGPSSVGIISPGKAKLGSIGSGDMAARVFMPGPVGVISKSGGMTSEIARVLSAAGFGQSTALGIGGDPLIGTDFLDAASLFEQDSETRAIIIFGEIGGSYEDLFAEALKRKEIKKPVIALIAGLFAEKLPFGTSLGHAGAIVERGQGAASAKIEKLKAAGAYVARTPEEIATILTKIL